MFRNVNEHAARNHGCRVTTVTISRQQHDLAVRRVAEAGLADRVEVRLQDFRDITGRFDKLVSIEMLNALNAISEDNSLLTMPPTVNPYLILAILNSMVLHAVIVYVPFLNEIFSIHAMNSKEWLAVLAFSAPVILIDEVLKFFGRMKNEAELKARLAADKKTN